MQSSKILRMKKLLLILICLFVSFEVKSKSDDLSGKKIVCKGIESIFITGFEFLNAFQVKVTFIRIDEGTMRTMTYNYQTTPVEISIGRLTTIDRLTLKMRNKTECKLIEGNFDSYMNDELEIIVNEIKSKQKI